jgi:multidrug efflux pump subunit AcrB
LTIVPPGWLVGTHRSPAPAFLVFAALVLGAVALWLTPREEEPQIVVPVADVMIRAPGLSPAQVSRQVATPVEKLLARMPGVEHVYARSERGRAVVTVRFHVGEDRESALVRLYNQLFSHTDEVPAAVESWVVKPVEIDDVPIVVAMLWSEQPERVDDAALERVAREAALRLQRIESTNRIDVVGGRPREWRVEIDPDALLARRTTLLGVVRAIGASSRLLSAGTADRRDTVLAVDAGGLIGDAEELGELVVNVVDGVPVLLGEVARVVDGPAEPSHHTWLRFGPAHPEPAPGVADPARPAVALAVAKQRGANAVAVAQAVLAELEAMRESFFPDGVRIEVIRDYGQTADDKMQDLIGSLVVAVVSVVLLLGLFLGWRAAAVVALAVPVCYGITLGLDLWAGYTLNRVTLFALILAIGLLVDDPITGVDNIDRHLRRGDGDAGTRIARAIWEIRAPLVMSTLAIVLAFLPLSFITGMMGPYMAPMAFNVPVTVIVSTAVTFLVTPWLARRFLATDGSADAGAAAVDGAAPASLGDDGSGAGAGGIDAPDHPYRRVMAPLLASRGRAWAFLAVIAALFAFACVLPLLRLVPLKLLPYDDKNELQVVLDLPEGSTLERTDAVARRFADLLGRVPEVRAVAGFSGTASPVDFNGLIRQYYLRGAPHHADLRITLAPADRRATASHALALRLRDDLEALARETGATLSIVEVPPGPPVLATVVLELHGDATTSFETLARAAEIAAERFRREPGVVDVDTSLEAFAPRLVFAVDRPKAALSGVATEDVAETVRVALDGAVAAYGEVPSEAVPLPVHVRLPYGQRTVPGGLEGVAVEGRAGVVQERTPTGLREAPRPLVRLGEIGRFVETETERSRARKDLEPVVYVRAELAGRTPPAVVLDLGADLRSTGPVGVADGEPSDPAGRTFLANGGGLSWRLPDGVQPVWAGEGEWWITLRVFRDLGIAFGVALAGIFVVLWIQTGLAALTGIIMLSIPLTVIGIMPGFWLLNVVGDHRSGGYGDPVLFTATAMIGMIALAGIVVRNALVLIEFVSAAREDGNPVREALLSAGAVRMRPVLLTAGTTLLGNVVITLDPIFSGLAWAIIFGILASTLFTLAVVPVVYWLVYGSTDGNGGDP